MTLILASSSPRRRDLLAQIGVEPEVRVADIDETPLQAESAIPYVQRMAKTKAIAVAQALRDVAQTRYVLAADTIGILDGDILVKPHDKADFLRMMQRMSNRTHQVVTSVSIIKVAGQQESLQESLQEGTRAQSFADDAAVEHRQVTVTTDVQFAPLTEAEMLAYWATGEPADKAGGYGIQARGALFVKSIQGSYSNVVGLPLQESAALLAEMGFALWTIKPAG